MADRRDQMASDLSYGWQKTLTLAIGIAASPRRLLLDEPLTGISPTRIEAIASLIRRARDAGTTICVIEHNLGAADKVYILRNGQIRFEGKPDEFSQDEFVQKVYLAG